MFFFPLTSSDFSRVLKPMFLVFPGGPGGFMELREADRNHFHLSWYLIVPGVTSYDQKPSWGDFLPSTVSLSLSLSLALFFLWISVLQYQMI